MSLKARLARLEQALDAVGLGRADRRDTLAERVEQARRYLDNPEDDAGLPADVRAQIDHFATVFDRIAGGSY